MKALTLRHPWPYCFARLGKDIENRSWPFPGDLVGQPIALHGGVMPASRINRAKTATDAQFVTDHIWPLILSMPPDKRPGMPRILLEDYPKDPFQDLL